MVHHHRKAKDEDPYNQISGTTSLTGIANTLISLDRKRGKNYAELDITGRSIEDKKVVLEFDDETTSWVYRDQKDFMMSEQRQEILDYLQDIYPDDEQPKEIANAIRHDPTIVHKLLNMMEKDGQIARVSHSRYSALGYDNFNKDSMDDELAMI